MARRPDRATCDAVHHNGTCLVCVRSDPAMLQPGSIPKAVRAIKLAGCFQPSVCLLGSAYSPLATQLVVCVASRPAKGGETAAGWATIASCVGVTSFDERDRNWSIFDGWSHATHATRSLPTWDVVEPMVQLHRRMVAAQREDIAHLLQRWDELLHDLGGDPTSRRWETFRPLRLSREEDWSDWLAHLLATSTTGLMASSLFGFGRVAAPTLASPQSVERESTYQSYRADLVIHWQDGASSHLEVKIGDGGLAKTFRASELIMAGHGSTRRSWTHFILLLGHQLDAWDAVAGAARSTVEVRPLVWADVCVAIRRALRANENITWKVWAWSFLGTVEETLIGYVAGRDATLPSQVIDTKREILRRGLEDDA